MKYSYPEDFASFILDRLKGTSLLMNRQRAVDSGVAMGLPDLSVLEHLISVCYQASLLREEERPVRFRVILCEQECFDSEVGPPIGLQRLVFSHPRPFRELELQRVSPAANFYRSLVGVRVDDDGKLLIWGIIHSGPRWIQTFYGGWETSPRLPLSLVIGVTGPGRITAGLGSNIIGSLNGGRIHIPSLEVFDSRWMTESFTAIREDLWSRHMKDREGKSWARLDQDFVRRIARQVLKRIISSVRNSQHGGTLLLLPPEMASELLAENQYVTIKYPFIEEEPRQRFRTLMLSIMKTLAEIYGRDMEPQRMVGWHEYITSKHEKLSFLKEAIFEMGHLIADLASVDGAVVLTKQMEMLGFGGEISGKLDDVLKVKKALDADGERTIWERTEDVGTRHRSVYRLCNGIRHALAIVISQDGDVRFVKWKDGAVTHWDQVMTSVLDF